MNFTCGPEEECQPPSNFTVILLVALICTACCAVFCSIIKCSKSSASVGDTINTPLLAVSGDLETQTGVTLFNEA